VTFEDLNTYNCRSSVFPIVNESIATWREALKDIAVEKAASICSGGEISFFAILPKVAEELQLIDHAYSSMYYAIGKHHVMEKLDAKNAHNVFMNEDKATIDKYFAKANEKLPTKGANTSYSYYYDYKFTTGALRQAWADVSQADIRAFKENLHKLTFLHGDISDLRERGPFDLVYLSNALDYAGRGGRYSHPIKEIVKPGGFVCFTNSASYAKAPVPSCLAKSKTLYEKEHRGRMRWMYRVVQTPA
jgi:hypothetical protein